MLTPYLRTRLPAETGIPQMFCESSVFDLDQKTGNEQRWLRPELLFELTSSWSRPVTAALAARPNGDDASKSRRGGFRQIFSFYAPWADGFAMAMQPSDLPSSEIDLGGSSSRSLASDYRALIVDNQALGERR